MRKRTRETHALMYVRTSRCQSGANIYLVISLVLDLTLDSFLRLEDTLDRHVRVQIARALHFALIPLILVALTLLLHCLPFHTHRQALLVPAVLTTISLSLVDDAGLLLAAGIRQILTHGPFKESFASLATERQELGSDKRNDENENDDSSRQHYTSLCCSFEQIILLF